MGSKSYIESLAEFIRAIDELTQSYNELKKEVERLSKELYNQKNLLNSIIESISEGVIAVDNNMNALLTNKFAEEFISQGILDIIDPKKQEEELNFKGKYVKITKYPLLLKNENIGRVIVIRDITKEKKLEEESKRRERLSAMGEIAVTLAHEIRNPLGSIELFAGLLKRNLEGENKRLAEAIISVSRSINKTVTDILLFTKSIDIQKEKVSIAEIVDDVIESLRHLISKKSAVVVVRGSRELSLQGSRELLKVCITNIITNALEAIDEKGRVEIEWEGDENYVTIIFRDDGIGIPENLKEEIFKPFFTTKRAGTGIGLAVVSRIVEAHGGTIEFTSKPGETEFRLKFSVS